MPLDYTAAADAMSRGVSLIGQQSDDYYSFDIADIAMGIPRGIASGVSDMVNLPLMAFGTEVPDQFGWGSTASTIGGDISAGISNFLTGFIPGIGIAGKLGRGAKFAKMAASLTKAADVATEAAILARKAGKIGTAVFQARKAKLFSQIPELAKYGFAGAFADFTAFDAHEARLSNLLRDYAGFRDPITEFLQADEDDGEIVGRLKNAIEGFGIGLAIDGLITGLKIYKAGVRARNSGIDPTPSMIAKAREIRSAQERDLMESFNLSEEQAQYVNLLIDMFGLDRGRLKILAGEDAVQFYDLYTDQVLKQVDLGKFTASEVLPEGSQLRYLMSDEELNAIRSPAELGRFMEQANRAERALGTLSETDLRRLDLTPDSPGIEALSRSIGPTRTQVFVAFSKAAKEIGSDQPQQAGMAMTELVLDAIRLGEKRLNPAEVGGRFPVDFAGNTAEMTALGNRILKEVDANYKAAKRIDPNITRVEVLDSLDLSAISDGFRFDAPTVRPARPFQTDSHTAAMIPDNLIPQAAEGVNKSWVQLRRDWIASKPQISRDHQALRQIAEIAGITDIDDRVLRSIAVATTLSREGVGPEEILRRMSREDLTTAWDFINTLTRKEINAELKRIGIDAGVIENLDGFASRVRSRFRLKAGDSLTSTHVSAAKAGSKLVPDATGAAARGILLSARDGDVRGFAKATGNGLSYIGGLRSPNTETAIHEISHVARHQLFDPRVPQVQRIGLSDSDILAIERWAGVRRDANGNPVWSIAAEEMFAEGLVDYIRKGVAPTHNHQIQAVFTKVSMWLRGLWLNVGKEVPGVPKEIAEVFDKLVSRGPGIEVTGVNVFTPTTAILRSTSPLGPASPTPSVSFTTLGGGVGEGHPRGVTGVDKYPYNINRSSSEAEARRNIRSLADIAMAARPNETVPWTTVKDRILDNAASLSRMLGTENWLTDFRAMTDIGPDAVWRVAYAHQALRQALADISSQMVTIAKKGATATKDEMYEFLQLRKVSEIMIDEIRQYNQGLGFALNLNRRVPGPTSTGKTLPPLLSPGKPPSASGLPEPVESLGSGKGGGAASESSTLSDTGLTGEGPGKGAGEGPGKGAGEGPGKGAGEGPGKGAGEGATPVDPIEKINAGIIDSEIEAVGGIEALIRMMEKTAAAELAGGAEGTISFLRGTRRWSNAIVEYWMNSILSGPVTHMVNITSNTLATLYLPFERALGSALVGDFPMVATQLRLYMNYLGQVRDSFSLAMQAVKQDAPILEAGFKTVETEGRAISAAGLGMAEDSLGGMATNWIGKILNIPTRMLSAEDEFFKQLHYRAHFKTNLHVEGIKRFNGDVDQAAKWSESIWNSLLEDGQRYSEGNMVRKAAAMADERISKGTLALAEKTQFISKFMADPKNWDEEAGVLSREALSQSRYGTFTTPLDPKSKTITTRIAAKAQAIANDMPFMRFVLPFIRTPTNLLNFALSRTLPFNTPYIKELMGVVGKELTTGDATRRAEIAGRLAFSMGAVSSLYLLAQSGSITGGGPREGSRRELWEATGWQPYSMKIGDKYVSYRRFDPFSTIIGLIADIVESYPEVDESTKSTFDSLAQVLVIAIGRNITNKTYLTGITNVVNAISNPEQYGGMVINNLAGSFVPFSGLSSQSIGVFVDDPVQREVRSAVDAMKARIPRIEESVAPRRNLFGEEIKKADRPPGIFSYLPIEYREEVTDPIMMELRNLDHGFTRPSIMKNNLDLTAYKTDSGQQAYDRWLQLHGVVKIGGMTLRERIRRLISSSQYQRLSDVSTDEYDSPRIRILRSIISKYRSKAYYEMLKEAPLLKQSDRIAFMNREALRRGASMEELQQLVRPD